MKFLSFLTGGLEEKSINPDEFWKGLYPPAFRDHVVKQIGIPLIHPVGLSEEGFGPVGSDSELRAKLMMLSAESTALRGIITALLRLSSLVVNTADGECYKSLNVLSSLVFGGVTCWPFHAKYQ
jgi:hypothetical protein